MRPVSPTTTEVVKCPSCAEQAKQELMGYVNDGSVWKVPPALYRCGACGFLYTVPKLPEQPPEPPPSLRDTTPI